MERLILAGCLALLLSACGPVRTDSVTQLSAQEVTALFTEQTVESVSKTHRRTSFTYYRADGHLLQRRYWSWRTGKWRVRSNGKICIDFGKERCRHIELADGQYFKVVKKGKARERLIRYRAFAQGNHLLAPAADWPTSSRFSP